MNDNLIQELGKVEANHRVAIENLVEKYEKSLSNMKNEITSTVKKLKESAGYYENVLNGIEEGYEIEIESNEQTKVKQKAKSNAVNMEEEVKNTKERHYYTTLDHKDIDKLTKESLDTLVQQKDFLHNITENIKNTLQKTENCQRLIGMKKIHIDHFQKDKNNLENLIIVLSNKIQELSDETKPLEK